MFLLNGQRLNPDTSFIVDGVNYPPQWLRVSTLAEKEALGITEVADPVRSDDRFYWVTENQDGTITSTPKDLTSLKATWTSWVDEAAWSLLNKTDYMDFRHTSDPTYTPPAAWVTWRAAIRTEAKTAKAAIAAATDISTLQTAIAVLWTPDPDAAAKGVQ